MPSDKNADLTSSVSVSHALGTFLLSLPADHLDHLDDNGDHLDHSDDNGDGCLCADVENGF